MPSTSTDRIEKQILLRAPRARVWKAIADAKEFGAWFGTEIDGAFVQGAQLKGRITNPGYEHVTLDFIIEHMEPERRLAYRWHPNAIEPGVDYSGEPTTLVEFLLEDAEGGTRLTVTESGFDRIPVERRAKALEGNDRGWAHQVIRIEKYLGSNP